MTQQRRLTISIISLLAACTASAENVYKSVDAQGRVTYSSTPPTTVPDAMVEKVQIAPGPTDQQKQDAAQRAKALETNRTRAEKEWRERRTQRSDADRDSGGAPMTGNGARIDGNDFWRSPATGSRVRNPGSPDRSDSNERQVRPVESSERSARSRRR